ncbi:polysaccharide deacetylase family protein [Salicibibacter cibarius]|uniref:Polysaccharide deacetylase family protein n=1 Tax=Salicibibacter cibarius TaxID=2743000 RepID=A0A7T7CBR4_9BACI|nr:polysaccharide deacetylase family protein [Salicibibacter cibarius]QQK76202.1 polysaccharide deacetylase family protein [Salicibibacter cibarius]
MRNKTMLLFLLLLMLTGALIGCNPFTGDPGAINDDARPFQNMNERQPEEELLDEDQVTTVQYETTPAMDGGSERDVRDPNPVSNVELQNAFPDIVTLQGPAEEKQVALTFDDGPDELITPAVLDKLDEYDVEATFFLIGERAEAHPDIVECIIDEGHVIANHSWNHPEFTEISNEEVEEQIDRTETVLNDITGQEVRMFRPPYGAQNEDNVRTIGDLNYSNIIWTQDSLDWKDLEVEEVADNILSDIDYGAIVLQHSAGMEGDEGLIRTVDALDKVIPELQDDNVDFVTVDELLGESAYR